MGFYPLGGGGENMIRSKTFREAECLSCTDLIVRVPMSAYIQTLNTSQPVSV